MARNIPVRRKKAPFPSQGLGYVFFGWSTLGKLHPLTDVSYANARLEPATPAHARSWAGSCSVWHLQLWTPKGNRLKKIRMHHTLATLSLQDDRFA